MENSLGGKDVFRLLQTSRSFLNSGQVETDWSALLKVTGFQDFSLELPESTSNAKKEGRYCSIDNVNVIR